MPDGTEPIHIQIAPHLAEIPADEWDACAGNDNPFLCHAFLSALEESGSVTPEDGWQPQHLTIYGEDGKLCAASPVYLKNNSYGEYVFDWGWADAFTRAGGEYYPKLISAVPFTPVTGKRLLIHPDAPAGMDRALAGGMVQLAEKLNVSSLHINFPTEDEWRNLGQAGMLQRIGRQFHWENRGYKTFDDFLADLSSRKRKTIAKERRKVAEHDIRVYPVTGADIEERHWDAFYRFYRNTSDRKWGNAYLTRQFFSMIGERMADKIMLVMVEDGDRLVGGALNLIGSDTLYGRNWGCDEHYRFLHFEACYYQAIDFAIEHGLKWVEAGAQGEHKIQRGYLPRTTYSAHWINDPGFRNAVEQFLGDERDAIKDEMAELAQGSPFKKASPEPAPNAPPILNSPPAPDSLPEGNKQPSQNTSPSKDNPTSGDRVPRDRHPSDPHSSDRPPSDRPPSNRAPRDQTPHDQTSREQEPRERESREREPRKREPRKRVPKEDTP